MGCAACTGASALFAAGMAGERAQTSRHAARVPRLRRVAAPAQAGPRAGRPLRRRRAGRDLHRRARATPRADGRGRPPLDPRRRDRRQAADARLDPQGVPGRSRCAGGVTHVDLQEVRLDQTINAVGLRHLIGGEDAPGVREGGVSRSRCARSRSRRCRSRSPSTSSSTSRGMDDRRHAPHRRDRGAGRRHAPRRPRDGRRRRSPRRRTKSSPSPPRRSRARSGGRGRGRRRGRGCRRRGAERAAEPEADAAGDGTDEG